MTTYPAASDRVTALTRKAGGSEAHSTDHGRVIRIWHNAMHHGADPTGATDSSAAIQAALDQALADTLNSGHAAPLGQADGVVYLPPGYYRINTSIDLYAGTILQGAGQGTVLLPFNGSNPVLQLDGTNWAPANIRVRDLTIGRPNDNLHGASGTGVSATTGTGHGVYLNGTSASTDVVFENVLFNQLQGTTTWAAKVNNTLEVKFDKCIVRSCKGGGFYYTGNSNAGVVRDCLMSNGNEGAIGGILSEADNVVISGNVIESWRGAYGAKVDGGRAIFMNNWCEDNYGTSLILTANIAAQVSGSYFAPAPTYNSILVTADSTNNVQATVQSCDIRGVDGITFVDAGSGTGAITATLLNNAYSTSGNKVVTTNMTHAYSHLTRIGEDFGVTEGRQLNIAKGYLTFGTSTTPIKWLTGAGSPESSITAPVGSLYTRTNGGANTTLYVKESGTGNTGWVAK